MTSQHIVKPMSKIWNPISACRCLLRQSLSLLISLPSSATKPWAYGLICYDEECQRHCHYSPTSDFFLSLHDVPVIIAAVDSKNGGNDRYRMLTQGASLVRLVNRFNTEGGGTQNFVLMAIYLKEDSLFSTYYLFQKC